MDRLVGVAVVQESSKADGGVEVFAGVLAATLVPGESLEEIAGELVVRELPSETARRWVVIEEAEGAVAPLIVSRETAQMLARALSDVLRRPPVGDRL